jgi:hypothetical protein
VRPASYDGGMAAAGRRPAAWACAATLLLAGCTYSAEEPGLFPRPRPATEPPSIPQGRFEPQPTNPKLPVAGGRLLVGPSSQLPVTMRIAVHAVRRIEGRDRP